MMIALMYLGWLFAFAIVFAASADIRALKKTIAELKERLNPPSVDDPSEESLVTLLNDKDRGAYTKLKTRARMLHVKILHGKYYVNSGHDPIATKVHLADVREYLNDLYKELENMHLDGIPGAALMNSLYQELENLQESLVQLEASVKVDPK